MKKQVAVVLLALTSGCNPFASEFAEATAACEGYLKERLKAPSTYKRLKASHSIGALSKEQFLQISPAGTSGDIGRRSVKLMPAPGVHTVVLEYEAENSFGAPLRSIEMCQFLMRDINSDEYEGYDLKGQAETRASMESLQAVTSQINGTDAPSPGCCLREGANQSIASSAKIVKVKIEAAE